MRAPLLVVGIDGLPPTLLRRFSRDGLTPNLARLAERGCSGILRSTPNYQSASAWTSLVTGVNPGRHGILHFTNPVPGSYEFAQIDARARLVPSVWRLLSDAGLRVAALNVPVSYPAERVEGVMIAGWLCPSPRSEGFAYPPELAQELSGYPIHADVRRYATAGRYDLAAAAARRGIETKLEVARLLLEREQPDVMCVVVTETDSLQHWCWHLLDDRHPDHSAHAAARWWEDLTGVYAALDRSVGRLLEAAGDDADVLIVSDHGQAPNSGGQVLLRPWLVHAGYFVPDGRGGARRAIDGALGTGVEALRRRAGNHAKAWFRARFPGLVGRAQAALRGVEADWSRTRAWTETGHVFVNTRGFWPEGCVEPGREREALLEELTQGMLALRDEATGRRAIASVTRGDDEFAGPVAELMPDLLVHWRNDLQVRRLVTEDGTVIGRSDAPELPPGAHHPNGTLLASGPRFRALDEQVTASIYDVAPTVLHLLGQDVPAYMDGRVLTDLMTPETAEDVRRIAVNAPESQGKRITTAGDGEVVAKRLRSLGYIE